MTCDSREFFTLFFHELEQRNIPYVILHSYQQFPDKFYSDIDYAVPYEHLTRLPAIQSEVARKNGWALVQNLHHAVFAYYAIIANRNKPGECLKLDVCSSYEHERHFLLSEEVLLKDRRSYRGFYVPSPASEFIYVLVKTFDAKGKSPAKYLPRLKELWEQDRDGAQRNFDAVFGDTGKTLQQWFALPPDDWRALNPIMRARNKFGPALMTREILRVIKRSFRPTGICVAVLGSDGAGKSTLLTKMRTMLEPPFRYQKALHFRPNVLGKRSDDDAATIANPHGRKPENALMSWLRVGFYFADNWAGWLFVVLPGWIRSTLVLFDRNFDDLLVDEQRYRLSGISPIVKLLRKLIPKPDFTFVLTAPAKVLHERKPELSIEELERQQKVFHELAHTGKNYVLVSAEQSPDDVARVVWDKVIDHLAIREERRS